MTTIIRNVLIYDGLGTKSFVSDICIESCKIKKIGKIKINDADDVIEAEGLAVCPGFIDVHSHSDLEIFRQSKLNYAIRQGITTELIGQDGNSLVPNDCATEQILNNKIIRYCGHIDKFPKVRNFKQYKKAINVACYDPKIESLVGYGAVRLTISKDENRELTNQEIAEARQIVQMYMSDGAKGVSVSLTNTPSCFANENEISEICKAVAEYDGIAMFYFGDEQNLLLESIDFVARIGKKTGARMHISQLKAVGINKGKLHLALEKIDDYVSQGLSISFDCYPYIAINSSIGVLIGDVVYNIDDIFNDDLLYVKTIKEINKNIDYHGEENIIISAFEKDKKVVGRTLKEIRNFMGITAAEIVLKLLKEDANTLGLFFSIEDDDLRMLLSHELSCICTDGILSEFPHPRVYGAFPRFIGNYVKNLNIMSIEQGIKKITSEPANHLRLWDRGILREGMTADIVLFDQNNIKDENSYMNPKVFPKGIKMVFVDGILKYKDMNN